MATSAPLLRSIPAPVVWLSLTLLAAGCGRVGYGASDAASSPVDAGTGGGVDAATVPADASPEDAAATDAARMDAGTPPTDAGPTLVDGGPDASPTFGTRPTASDFHTCTTRRDGHVSCWGVGAGGILGTGVPGGVFPTGQPVPSIAEVISVCAASRHTCALHAGGFISCWGQNDYGQLGDATNTQRLTPVRVVDITGVSAVACGSNRTCAIIEGHVWCWGQNTYGQLGDGMTADRNRPFELAGITDAVQLALTDSGTCVRRASSDPICFGLGYFGDGVQTSDPSTRAVSPLPDGLVALAAGRDHFCALAASGVILCWGQNGAGQVGIGGTGVVAVPTEVSLPSARSIWLSGSHTCAQTTIGEMYCWGFNVSGVLGDGTTMDHLTPTRAPLYDGAVGMALGPSHTCFVTGPEVMRCLGSNVVGMLGDGTMTDSLTAVPVMLD